MRRLANKFRPKQRHVTAALLFFVVLHVASIVHVATWKREPFLGRITMFASHVVKNNKYQHWAHYAVPESKLENALPHLFTVRLSRFDERWSRVLSIKTLNLKQSNHRVLYSSMSDKSGDGLGHSLATFNAEVSTALHLGLTYTHRKATFSSLTRKDKNAVELFFGFGYGEIPRENIQRTVCDMEENLYDGVYDVVGPQAGSKLNRICAPCGKMRPLPHIGSLVDVRTMVELPQAASFPTTIGCNRGEYSSIACRKRVSDELLAEYPSHTLFTMTHKGCDTMGPNSEFEDTAGWFYDHYWRRPSLRNRSLSLDPSELTITIHARRGDFLSHTNTRKATPSRSFQNALADIIMITKQIGGPFAALPVAIHIYSEGIFNGAAGAGHDVRMMQKVFVGVDGKPETAKQWEMAVKNLIPNLNFHLRVELHIAQETLSSLHEMVTSDVFIGSDSGMSIGIVKSLSRGVVLLPGHVNNSPDAYRDERTRFGTSAYNRRSGQIEYSRFAHHWAAYSKDFQSN